jgi:methylase of polypeptide subunit release factors
MGDLYCAGVIPSDADWSRLASVKLTSAHDTAIVTTTRVALEIKLANGLVRLGGAHVSRNGGVIYYTDRLDRCLVYEYTLETASAASVTAAAQIMNPELLYDVASTLPGVVTPDAEAAARSALKNALVYGHKIVAHRNTIAHVDRRRDEGTAGPYIDTMILNEVLHRYIYEWAQQDADYPFRSAAEIGSGCGLLIAACGQHLPGAVRVFAVDPSIAASACTYKNFFANNRPRPDRRFIAICGTFEDTDLREIDLAICNPPYIPEPPGRRRRTAPSPNVGTELLQQVVRKASTFLSDNGLLFLIFSELAWNDFEEAVTDAVEWEPIGPQPGFRVQFDHNDVLQDANWVQFLVEERNLDFNRATHIFHHHLRCVAVHKRRRHGFRNDKMLEHIKTLNNGFRHR